MLPTTAFARSLTLFSRPRSPPAPKQSRHASTTRNPTPNQFAKNASEAYAKQRQSQYQSKPRESPAAQKQKPQTQSSTNSPSQDIGAGARIHEQSGSGSLVYRLLTTLSSTFRLPSVTSTPPASSSSPNQKGGTYSVHTANSSRQNLRSAAAAVSKPSNHASVRQKLGYDNVARRVLLAMVAMPIVLVTSWVLFQRLVRGEEKRVFPVKPLPRSDAGEMGREVEQSSGTTTGPKADVGEAARGGV